MLSGAYTPKQIAVMARDEWGFRTPIRKRIGGSPLAMSSIYNILNNPFYAGIIVWDGKTFPGRHEPVVSIDQFQMVQKLLNCPGRRKPQKYTFPFTGMIRCGACGLLVTAEHKVNRYGYRYVYYHCSKSQLKKCAEPSVEGRALEGQVKRFLKSVAVDRDIEDWILKEMTIDTERLQFEEKGRRHSLERALKDVSAQLGELTGLRLRSLLTDDEFVFQRQELQHEKMRLQEKIDQIREGRDPIEPFREVISFSSRAVLWFSRGNDQSKRLIMETATSNLFLSGKIVKFEAKKPFASLANCSSCPRQLGVGDDVRTLRGYCARLAKKIWDDTRDEEGQRILHNIKLLRQHFEPDAVAKEEAPRSRRAVVVQGVYRVPGVDGSWHAPPQC